MKTFYFRPDTSNGMSETIQFNNDIITSFNGTEQRISLLQQPRYSVAFSYVLSSSKLKDFNSFIYNNQEKENYIPMWFNKAMLEQDFTSGNTIYIETKNKDLFVNQKIMIIDRFDNFEIATITAINVDNIEIEETLVNTYNAFSTDVVPVKIGRINETLSKTLLTGNLATFNASFNLKVSDDQIIDDKPISFPIVDDKYLILKEPNRITPITQTFNRNVYELDLGYGIREFEELQDQYFINYNYTHELMSRDEIQEYKSFINALAGRQKEFLMPSWEEDFLAVESQNYLSTDDKIKVYKQDNENYSDTFGQKQRNIIIYFKDGSYLIKSINSSNDISPTVEEIVFSESLGIDIDSDYILHIMFLNESRFLNDNFTFSYLTDEICSINKNIRVLKFKDLP